MPVTNVRKDTEVMARIPAMGVVIDDMLREDGTGLK